MPGADAFGHRILRQGIHPDVADFRMGQAVDRPAAEDEAPADAGAHRHIQAAAQPPGRPQLRFRQGRGVHIRIQRRRHPQRLPEGGQDGIIPPGQLRRRRDGPIGRGGRIQVQGPEAPDAQGLDGVFPEKGNHLRHGFLRGAGGQGTFFQGFAPFIHDRQHHLGAAGLQRSVQAAHRIHSSPCFAFFAFSAFPSSIIPHRRGKENRRSGWSVHLFC